MELGVNIMPIGFFVSSENGVKMLPVNHCSSIDKLLDYVPDLLDKISELWNTEKVYKYEFYEDENGKCSAECECGCEETSDKEKD